MALRRTMLLLIALALLLVKPARIVAQNEARPAKTLDVSHISDDFFAALVIHPARLMASPGLKGAPLEEFSKIVQEHVGLEPSQLEQVILLLPRQMSETRKYRIGEKPPPMPLVPATIIRLRDGVVNQELITKASKGLGLGDMEQAERGGKTYWKTTGDTEAAFYAPDKRTLILANERRLNSMVSDLAAGGRFVGLLRKVDASADVLAVVEPSAIVEQLAASGELDEDLDGGPEALIANVVLQVLRRVQSYTFSADFAAGTNLRWEIAATSPEDAELLHDLIRGWQATFRLALPSLLRAMHAEAGTPLEAQMQALAGRLMTEVLTGIKTSRKDDRVVMQLETKRSYVELFSLAGKALIAARQEAPLIASSNNLKQLAIGMHNYNDTLGSLPPHASYKKTERGDDGKDVTKPLLSWRVHLLPFMEETRLWGEFRFDEPWDSDHNKKLIAKMPAVFKSPGLELGEGKTCYVVPVSRDMKYGTIFPPGVTARNQGGAGVSGLPLVAITDGTANTVMIVEAPPEKAVIWTKPDDWEVNAKEPKKGLFGARAGFLLAAFADASVHRIPEKISTENLLRFVGRSDGEIADHEEVTPAHGSRASGRSRDKKAAVKSIDLKPSSKASRKPDFDGPDIDGPKLPRPEQTKERAVPPSPKE
jgi:hypothetical protein